MKSTLRIGLVGAGSIAQTWAQALAGCDDVRLVAVCDTRPDVGRALAESAGCKSYASHQAMLEERLDAVIVCTPPVSHPEICIHFLEHKVHVLCEKPLSIDSAGAQAMLEAARANGMKFTMASKFRYAEDVVRAKAIVSSGILGDIVLFENAFTSRVDMTTRWNSKPEVSGGGVLIDNGTHSVDIARYFLGPLAEIQVVEGRRSQGLDVEETVRVFVRSTSGVIGNIDLSWSINKELDSYINIYGTHGTVWVGWKESKYRQASSRDWIVFGKGYDKLQSFVSQIETFAGAIRGERELLITPEDGVASVRAIETAYASLRRNHWERIEKAAGYRLQAAG